MNIRFLTIISLFAAQLAYANGNKDSVIVADMHLNTKGMQMCMPTYEVEKEDGYTGIPDNTANKIMTCNLTKARKELSLVTGIQRNGRCFCVLDMNNNRDFSDDYCYRFRLSEDDTIDEFSKQPLVYDTSNGKKAALWIAPIFIWKDGTERDDISNLQCWINFGYTYECDINIGGKDYHIDIYPFGSKHYQYKINKTQKESKYVGTPARIGNVCLNVTDIDESQQACTINIRTINGTEDLPTVPNEGFKAPVFECKDIKGKPFSLEKERGKYVLIDFWGTWCNPCIAALPTLREIYEKYGKKIKIVSIATDLDSGHSVSHAIPTLKSVIKKHKMEWTNIHGGLTLEGPIIKKYMIESYPTSVLIDPDGVIVSMDSGTQGLKDVEKVIEKIFENDDNH